jgi:transcriptional regulator with XRE-family HTH domain
VCAAVHDLAPTPLAAIRKRHLLSQRDLAHQAGVALSTVYLLEAGKTERTTFKVMRAVSAALGVEPNSIAEFRRTIEAKTALPSGQT